jgi:hypothetical protein
MLDVFMFFSLLGTYLTFVAKNKKHYRLAGLIFCFALASKWEAAFLVIPSPVLVMIERKCRGATIVLATAVVGHTLSYASLILAEEIFSFLNLQMWMYQFMFGVHGLGRVFGRLERSLVATFIFHTTTFDYLTVYDPLFHPEGFRFLAANYISFTNQVNPLITLLFFPC